MLGNWCRDQPGAFWGVLSRTCCLLSTALNLSDVKVCQPDSLRLAGTGAAFLTGALVLSSTALKISTMVCRSPKYLSLAPVLLSAYRIDVNQQGAAQPHCDSSGHLLNKRQTRAVPTRHTRSVSHAMIKMSRK